MGPGDADCVETQFALGGLISAREQRLDAEAYETQMLAQLAADPDPYRDGSGELGKQWIVEDIACALKIPSVTAAAKLHVAHQLATRFPATYTALRAGRIELRSATKLVDAAESLPDRVLPGLEVEVLEALESRTHAQFCARLRRAVLKADPRGADEQHQTAQEQRRVVFTPVEHGMTELWALLPADGAVALKTELHRRAETTTREGDDRTADQRRADALCDLFADTPTAAAAGSGPQINVTVPLATLTGTSDEPGELHGHGPIPAALARAIAHDPTGTWRRLVTDPHGRLVDVTSRRYRPPAPMRRLVELRDRTCRFPTCQRTAATCELDHVTPRAEGGRTTPANLIPLCRRHHHTKHDGHWHVQRLPDGTVRWTSPTRHTYDRPPPDPLTA